MWLDRVGLRYRYEILGWVVSSWEIPQFDLAGFGLAEVSQPEGRAAPSETGRRRPGEIAPGGAVVARDRAGDERKFVDLDLPESEWLLECLKVACGPMPPNPLPAKGA